MTYLRTHLAGVAVHSRIEGQDLIVDGNNFCYWFFQLNHGIEDLAEVSRMVIQWYHQMSRDNRLHFIFDGGFDERRREVKYERFLSQIEAIVGPGSGSSVTLPLLFVECVIQTVRSVRGTVFISEGDADRAIISYAEAVNAFAVLSDDTDFLFFGSPLQVRLVPLWAFGLDEHGALFAHVIEQTRVCRMWKVPQKVKLPDDEEMLRWM